MVHISDLCFHVHCSFIFSYSISFNFKCFSADFQQREKEKARIEKAFKESDKKLGDQVKGNCEQY